MVTIQELVKKETKKDQTIEVGKTENYDSLIIFLRGINNATDIFKEENLIATCPNTKLIFLKFLQEIEDEQAIGGGVGYPIVSEWYKYNFQIEKSKSSPPSVQTFEKYQDWYKQLGIKEEELEGYDFRDGRDNFQRINAVITNEISLNSKLNNRRIIIAGFSQGASLALAYAVNHNSVSSSTTTLGGVISLNGFLPLVSDVLSAIKPKRGTKAELPAKSKVIPFLLCNTNDDHLVPYWTGEMSSKILRDKLGYQKVEFLDGQPTETERKKK